MSIRDSRGRIRNRKTGIDKRKGRLGDMERADEGHANTND